jgi:hypothetical protein
MADARKIPFAITVMLIMFYAVQVGRIVSAFKASLACAKAMASLPIIPQTWNR